MKNIKDYIIESQSNKVPVEAMLEFLKDFNPDNYNDTYFIDMLTMEYKVSQDIAEELVRVLGDAAMDEAVEIDPKLCDDLFNADKFIKKEVKSDLYLAAYKHGRPDAYAIAINRRNAKELASTLAKIQWKPTNHNVIYNFK